MFLVVKFYIRLVPMPILNFIESLKSDRKFSLQIVEHRYIPPVKAQYMKLVLSVRLKDALKKCGINLFYSRQVEAINLIRQGENVTVMTPTASGKSLIYNIPVLESIIENPELKALYIFPLKGLEQDQVRNLNELHEAVAGISSVSVKAIKSLLNFGEVYDEDTTAYRRKKIREAIPNVIFTNPDMLHLAINAFHKKWEAFFRNLKFVVIDKIHTYRGIFGSNVAYVIRRLRRICKYRGFQGSISWCNLSPQGKTVSDYSA